MADRRPEHRPAKMPGAIHREIPSGTARTATGIETVLSPIREIRGNAEPPQAHRTFLMAAMEECADEVKTQGRRIAGATIHAAEFRRIRISRHDSPS
jgi:hypothetical protein